MNSDLISRSQSVPVVSISACIVAISLVSLQATAGAAVVESDSKLNLDLPYDAFGVPVEEETPESITFYAQLFEGDGFFFCLDRSSSTGTGELRIEKLEAIRAITQFSDRVRFGIVFYDQGVLKWPSTSQPAVAGPIEKAAAITWLSTIESGFGTCVLEGLLESLAFANRSSARRNVVIYEGDGGTTCRNRDPGQYAEQTLATVTARNSKRHQINAICVGPDSVDADTFCKRLAAMNGGTYKRIDR